MEKLELFVVMVFMYLSLFASSSFGGISVDVKSDADTRRII
jgi:hypothetical protein